MNAAPHWGGTLGGLVAAGQLSLLQEYPRRAALPSKPSASELRGDGPAESREVRDDLRD